MLVSLECYYSCLNFKLLRSWCTSRSQIKYMKMQILYKEMLHFVSLLNDNFFVESGSEQSTKSPPPDINTLCSLTWTQSSTKSFLQNPFKSKFWMFKHNNFVKLCSMRLQSPMQTQPPWNQLKLQAFIQERWWQMPVLGTYLKFWPHQSYADSQQLGHWHLLVLRDTQGDLW